MQYRKRPFEFPYDKTIRVIIDTDCNNECDDQYCVTHALLTPRFDIKGIVAEQFGTARTATSEQESYDEICKLVSLLGKEKEVNICHGAESSLSVQKKSSLNNNLVYRFKESEGARLIINEALKDDPRPLFVANIGAITNLATAYLMCPKIADRLCAIWIGGNSYPDGGWEFNLFNDIEAARIIFQSKMELWQIPSNVYTKMKVSFYELLEQVYPCGKIGKYLVENTIRYAGEFKKTVDAGLVDLRNGKTGKRTIAESATCIAGEMWSLGDSPVVGLMINNTCGEFHYEAAPEDVADDGHYILGKNSSRKIRVYDSIDSHFILNDMFAKLKYHYK